MVRNDGSVWRNSNGYDYVGYLWSNGAKRKLNLNNVDNDWNDNYRFLAVRNCFYGFSWLV